MIVVVFNQIVEVSLVLELSVVDCNIYRIIGDFHCGFRKFVGLIGVSVGDVEGEVRESIVNDEERNGKLSKHLKLRS